MSKKSKVSKTEYDKDEGPKILEIEKEYDSSSSPLVCDAIVTNKPRVPIEFNLPQVHGAKCGYEREVQVKIHRELDSIIKIKLAIQSRSNTAHIEKKLKISSFNMLKLIN